MNGEHGADLAEYAIEAAAEELIVAAGRPEGWTISSEYEREAWRVAARRTVRAYLEASGLVGEIGRLEDALETARST